MNTCLLSTYEVATMLVVALGIVLLDFKFDGIQNILFHKLLLYLRRVLSYQFFEPLFVVSGEVGTGVDPSIARILLYLADDVLELFTYEKRAF